MENIEEKSIKENKSDKIGKWIQGTIWTAVFGSIIYSIAFPNAEWIKDIRRWIKQYEYQSQSLSPEVSQYDLNKNGVLGSGEVKALLRDYNLEKRQK